MQEAVEYLDVNAALAMADMLLVRQFKILQWHCSYQLAGATVNAVVLSCMSGLAVMEHPSQKSVHAWPSYH